MGLSIFGLGGHKALSAPRYTPNAKSQATVKQFIEKLQATTPDLPKDELAIRLAQNRGALTFKLVNVVWNSTEPKFWLHGGPPEKGQLRNLDFARLALEESSGKLMLQVGKEDEPWTTLRTAEDFDHHGLTDSSKQQQIGRQWTGAENSPNDLFLFLDYMLTRSEKVFSTFSDSPFAMKPTFSTRLSLAGLVEKLQASNADGAETPLLELIARLTPLAAARNSTESDGFLTRDEYVLREIDTRYLPDLLEPYLKLDPSERGKSRKNEGASPREFVFKALSETHDLLVKDADKNAAEIRQRFLAEQQFFTQTIKKVGGDWL